MNKLIPLGKRVLVKVIEGKKTTDSGLILPESTEDSIITAKVIAVSKTIEIDIKEEDTIILGRYTGTKVDNRKNILIVEQDDILAIKNEA